MCCEQGADLLPDEESAQLRHRRTRCVAPIGEQDGPRSPHQQENKMCRHPPQKLQALTELKIAGADFNQSVGNQQASTQVACSIHAHRTTSTELKIAGAAADDRPMMSD